MKCDWERVSLHIILDKKKCAVYILTSYLHTGSFIAYFLLLISVPQFYECDEMKYEFNHFKFYPAFSLSNVMMMLYVSRVPSKK